MMAGSKRGVLLASALGAALVFTLTFPRERVAGVQGDDKAQYSVWVGYSPAPPVAQKKLIVLRPNTEPQAVYVFIRNESELQPKKPVMVRVSSFEPDGRPGKE